MITYTLKNVPSIAQYSIQGEYLNRVTTIKDLGVYFDAELRFNIHIEKIMGLGLRNLGFVIRNCRSFTKIEPIILLFKSIVLTKLEYASLVWSPYTVYSIKNIEKVQNKFLKFIHYKKFRINPEFSSYQPIRETFNLPKLEDRRIAYKILFLYKVFNNLVDCTELLDKFQLNVPSYRMRYKFSFYVDFARTNVRLHSPILSICTVFNSFSSKLDVGVFDVNYNAFRKQLRTLRLL